MTMTKQSILSADLPAIERLSSPMCTSLERLHFVHFRGANR